MKKNILTVIGLIMCIFMLFNGIFAISTFCEWISVRSLDNEVRHLHHLLYTIASMVCIENIIEEIKR